MLIFFRILQGSGGGMIMPVAMSVLAQTAGPQRIGRVMSVVGVPTLLGPILGPVIGGLIVDSTTWRWIFYVNVPVAILALCLAARLLPSDTGRADAGRLDWVGLGLISPGLAGIVFGLSETESHGGIADPVAFGPILAGVVLVALFALHGLRAERPLIDLGLFRSPRFSAAAATTFALGGALFGTMLVLPLYFQVARGESALAAGLLMAPQGLGAALSLSYAGRLADRVGGGRVALVGCSIMTLATLPLAAISAKTPFALLAGVLFVRGVGLGAAMMPAISSAYARLDPAQMPRATSAVNALQRVGGSIGTALLAVVLQSATRSAVPSGSASGRLQPVPTALRERLADPLASAFSHTFALAAGLSLLAVIAAALLARSERSGEDAKQHEPRERAQAHAAVAS
jgi:EmrB/QacA subfamily drug resistance transporter